MAVSFTFYVGALPPSGGRANCKQKEEKGTQGKVNLKRNVYLHS